MKVGVFLPLFLCTCNLFFLIYLFFNWRIIALKNFVVFCQAATWISHRYTYTPPFWTSLPSPSLLPLLIFALFCFPGLLVSAFQKCENSLPKWGFLCVYLSLDVECVLNPWHDIFNLGLCNGVNCVPPNSYVKVLSQMWLCVGNCP